MGEALSGIIQTDMMVTAGQHRIQKQRIDICFETAAVQLDGKFITKDKSYRPGMVFFIVFSIQISGKHDLLQRNKTLIGNTGKMNVTDNFNALDNKVSAFSVPNIFTVVQMIKSTNLMHSR